MKHPVRYSIQEETVTGRGYKPGTVFRYSLLIPDAEGDLALWVGHDGRNPADEKALMRLAEEGKAPYCVFLAVKPGTLPLDNGSRGMRLDEYDLFTRDYADFLVYELIPHIVEKHSLRLSPSPDWHMTSGGSSGGISAFTLAWFRPDFFRRVYMSSPSFLAMGRGNELPVLIRKYEPKPIRVYEEYSENEPNDYFGSSYCAAKEAEMALEFAGYDFRCAEFPGESHCSRLGDEEEAYRRLEWLWENYDRIPVSPAGQSPRVSQVVPPDSRWERTDSFPSKKEAVCCVLSSDRQMTYYGSEQDDVLFRAPADREGQAYCHGMLHTLAKVSPRGAIDLAIDEDDRLYALTAVGIQCVRSFGLIDVILDLPDGSRPLRIAFGDTDRDRLYVITERGIYRRKMRVLGAGDKPTPPKCTGYYD